MILRGQVFSKALEMETGLCVLVPNGFTSDAPYKVAYLLHGMAGCCDDFINYTMLATYAEAYHCIFVMPNAVRSIYSDMVYGQRYFTYIAEELPRICKRIFHISAEPSDAYIMGNSMGGYGAMKCALTYPERYAACCANAPGPVELRQFLRTLDEQGDTKEMKGAWGEQFIKDYRATFGQHFTYTPEADLLELAKRIQKAEDAPRLLVQIGTSDYLLEYNRVFQAAMKELPLDFAYEESGGKHDWDFFDKAQRRGLAYFFEE